MSSTIYKLTDGLQRWRAPRKEKYILNMYFYKLWTWHFIEHVQIPYFILSHFFGSQTCGLAGSTLHFYCSMSSKQHSEFRDIQIHRRTPGLADSRTDGLKIEYVLHITCNIYGRLLGWSALNIHFLDRGFSGWQTQNWAYIVLCAANNT